MISFNKFIVEPYVGERSLRSNNSSGFAMIEQRTALKGLRTLADATIAVGAAWECFPKGSIVYVREELFFQPGWGQKVYNADGIVGGCMIVDYNNVEFIKSLGDDGTEI